MKRETGRPGILPLLDSNLPTNPTPEDRPWLVTPLATPFHKLGLAGAAGLRDLVRRMEAVARTLSDLHSEGKWHRDLKPDNLFDLDGLAVVGDFGLVDYPDKGAVTEATELMGPLFYLAPEMIMDAADKPAGPGNVYALGKTLWVLASAQAYPLQGEQRADTPALRLSTYCPHGRASILDRLLDRATRFDPAARPTMKEIADELAAWLEQPQPAAVALDLQALSREYQGVFEANNATERRREEFITDARGILSTFDGMLERIARETAGVTRIPPEVGVAYDLPPFVEHVEAFGTPSVLWREAHHVETVAGRDFQFVRLQSFVHVEALSDETIRIVVGHLVRYEAGQSRELVDMNLAWNDEAVAPWGSALLQNEEQRLYTQFLSNLGKGIQAFAEQVKAISG